MKRPRYVPGDRICIVVGRHTGRKGQVVRVIAPALEARVDGDRVYQFIGASVRPLPRITEERKAA